MLLSFHEFSLLESIEHEVLFLKKGTVLYHGTSSEFDKQTLVGGGYDNMIWTAENPLIARTYIPESHIISLESSDIVYPSSNLVIQAYQKSIGIEYDMSDVVFERNKPVSYSIASVFRKFHEEYNSKEKEYLELEYKCNDYKKRSKTIDDELENDKDIDAFFEEWDKTEDKLLMIKKELIELNVQKKENEYVNSHLQKIGYKPVTCRVNSNCSWKLKYDKTIKPHNYKIQGRLLKLTLKRDFKIYDITYGETRESDLTELDYHNLDLFDTVRNTDFDGVKITDFAQHSVYGNVGHYSIGLYRKSLSDVTIEESISEHPDTF